MIGTLTASYPNEAIIRHRDGRILKVPFYHITVISDLTQTPPTVLLVVNESRGPIVEMKEKSDDT